MAAGQEKGDRIRLATRQEHRIDRNKTRDRHKKRDRHKTQNDTETWDEGQTGLTRARQDSSLIKTRQGQKKIQTRQEQQERTNKTPLADPEPAMAG
jgi:hypothetical protein